MLSDQRTTKISWHGIGVSRMSGSGSNYEVSRVTEDAINIIAMRIAASHYERVYRDSPRYSPNLTGVGAAIASHLPETDPETWETFKGDAISIITALHGSGEKDLAWTGSNDTRQYFDALHDLAADLRK